MSVYIISILAVIRIYEIINYNKGADWAKIGMRCSMEKVNINLLVGLDTKVKLDYLNTNFKAAKVFNIKDYGKGKSSKHNLEVALAT